MGNKGRVENDYLSSDETQVFMWLYTFDDLFPFTTLETLFSLSLVYFMCVLCIMKEHWFFLPSAIDLLNKT